MFLSLKQRHKAAISNKHRQFVLFQEYHLGNCATNTHFRKRKKKKQNENPQQTPGASISFCFFLPFIFTWPSAGSPNSTAALCSPELLENVVPPLPPVSALQVQQPVVSELRHYHSLQQVKCSVMRLTPTLLSKIYISTLIWMMQIQEIFLEYFCMVFSFLENFSLGAGSHNAPTLSLTQGNPTMKWPGDREWNLATAAYPEWSESVHGGPNTSSASFPCFAKFQLWRCSPRD